MSASEYQFCTDWRVPGTCEQVYAILQDAADLPRWWPSVYLDVRVRATGGAQGVGQSVELYTKGWLPYTLRWTLQVTEADPPRGFALDATGDLTGKGVWSLEPQGDETLITYDWRVRADKPLLRLLSPLFKPILAANHRWAMAQGLESLRLELSRRASSGPVPSPPGPTFARWLKPSPL